MQATIAIIRSDVRTGRRSISDDDLCATCLQCQYLAGDLSGCSESWPCKTDADDYVTDCDSYQAA